MSYFKNKNIIITGGSDGIGLGIARVFAQKKANLILIGRNKTKLLNIQRELTNDHSSVQIISADLSNLHNIPTISQQIISLTPQIDVLIHNAGIGQFKPFIETDEALLDLHLNLNVKTPYLLTQALLPSLIKTKGNIINISSYFAERMLPERTTTAYSLTKGALNSFTKSLAFEIGHLGVRVNAIAPGSVSTEQLNNNLQLLSTHQQNNFYKMIKDVYPLEKIGAPEDIGKAAAFLASEDAQWITSTIFKVDGGLTTN
ncbi:3-oxoacyl-[acyl-carrier-protein] reductase [Commensalibacter intestini A911]|uniref:3-oxoacyl-[acyl-carrier-protein] reductase n=1 Tax=Commensalibacter intestini A911 TaxID=1088868 RepID=G6F2G0_9PROT|nr:SDR family oxidoreductase [Commensalibacter intestini]EHD13614.1 3-oxoacyl-[acyl-carrier-protein] reductase [Commensalibacter intestini A911]